MKCSMSIKKSYRRIIWQAKTRNHTLYSLGSAKDLIDKAMFIGGLDNDGRGS